MVGQVAVALGDIVQLAAAGAAEASPLGLVQALWRGKKGGEQVQVRSVVRGSETVLGDAASQDELFVTNVILARQVSPLRDACLMSLILPSSL